MMMLVEAGAFHALRQVDEQVGHHPARSMSLPGQSPRQLFGAVALRQEPGEMKWLLHCAPAAAS